MKCQLLKEQCIACGRCILQAPEILNYYDDGIVKFNNSDNDTLELSGQNLLEFKKACRVCPTRALLIDE